MRSADQISASLMDAERALSSLGARPPGDVAALKLLAKTVRQEADNAAAAGRLTSGVPDQIVFVGPAATRFAAHNAEVARSAFVAQQHLDDAADAIARKAGEIAKAQHAYDRSRSQVEGRISALRQQLARAG